jgi:hypothetical protein
MQAKLRRIQWPGGRRKRNGHERACGSIRLGRNAFGPASAWPDSLKAPVRILLTSGFPMWMAWGPDLTMLYNDAYARTTLSKKHPWALGRPAPEVWHEIWDDIGPLIRSRDGDGRSVLGRKTAADS